MYGPSTLPVTGAATLSLSGLAVSLLSPEIAGILFAATIVTVGVVVWNSGRLGINQLRMKKSGKPIIKRRRTG